MRRSGLMGGRLWDRVRPIVGQYPRLYLPLARLRYAERALAVDDRTELVIEGYPRSANTFALVAFQAAQVSPVRIAHHLHVPAQVIEAVHRQLPTLVLVREPSDAVLSRLVRKPHLTPRRALDEYARFHRRILPCRHGFVVASFDEVTHDFGRVTDTLNQRFRTGFGRFEHTDARVRECFEAIDRMDSLYRDSSLSAIATVGHPSAERDAIKDVLRRGLREPEIAPLLEECRGLFAALLAGRA